MGILGELLSFVRRTVSGSILDEAKVDTGGNSKTVQNYGPPGEDSRPLPGDFGVLVETGGRGEMGSVAWHDTKTERKAGDGEVRRYARSATGTASCEIWLKANGEVVLEVFTDQTLYLRNRNGRTVIDCPDVRIGDEGASQQVACVGDLVVGAINALAPQGSPGVPLPLLPVSGSPSPSGGIPFAAQIVSGRVGVKAGGS